MRLIRENKGTDSTRMKPLEKRVLITNIVAETHAKIARSGAFRKAFVATGTWLAPDHSDDAKVHLEGVKFNFKEIITQKSVSEHQKKIEIQKAREELVRREAVKYAEEKASQLAKRFAPSIERSKLVQAEICPLVNGLAIPKFNIIASHINKDFICAGSFPAALLASVWGASSASKEKVKLIFNDIDVYFGEFHEGTIERLECTWTTLDGIDKEVNKIYCRNVNVDSLMANCDINAVAVFVIVKVVAKKVFSAEWVVGPQFWDFLLFDRVLRSQQTDSPARTLIRLTFKSYQMGLPFSEEPLSLLDGEVFSSHKKKHEEMLSKWKDYPFKHYGLKHKSKKSYKFRRTYVECPCGRKGNLNCTYLKCSQCCKKQLGECKSHKVKHSEVENTGAISSQANPKCYKILCRLQMSYVGLKFVP